MAVVPLMRALQEGQDERIGTDRDCSRLHSLVEMDRSVGTIVWMPGGGMAVRSLRRRRRWQRHGGKEEDSHAKREFKRIGLLRELRVHGPEAFDDVVVEWKRGPRSEVPSGPTSARSRSSPSTAERLVRCKQTLNLTGVAKEENSMQTTRLGTVWLVDEMEEYVECRGTSLVPSTYVNRCRSTELGKRLVSAVAAARKPSASNG